MPGYTPLLAGHTFTFTAAAPVRSGDPVEVAGDLQVQRVSSLTAPYAGVAGHDADAGAKVTVHLAGPVHTGTCPTAVSAGDPLLASATAGTQVRTAPPTGDPPTGLDEQITRAIVGLALSSAPAGGRVTWLSVH